MAVLDGFLSRIEAGGTSDGYGPVRGGVGASRGVRSGEQRARVAGSRPSSAVRRGRRAAHRARPAQAVPAAPGRGRASCAACRGRASWRSMAWTSTCRAAQTVAVVGECGSGKSTLARVDAAAHRAGRRVGRVRRHGRGRGRPDRDAHAPEADADRVPGPVLVAQPAHDRGRASCPRCSRSTAWAAAGTSGGSASSALLAGRGPRRRPRVALPARVQRRPAAAHRHRAGARAQAGPRHPR